jgi:hypothetical protein
MRLTSRVASRLDEKRSRTRNETEKDIFNISASVNNAQRQTLPLDERSPADIKISQRGRRLTRDLGSRNDRSAKVQRRERGWKKLELELAAVAFIEDHRRAQSTRTRAAAAAAQRRKRTSRSLR